MEESLAGIYGYVFEKEITRWAMISEDPTSFMNEVGGFVDEPNPQTFLDVLSDEVHLKRIWGGLLLLGELRENGDSRWFQHEPTVRAFWQRATPLFFHQDPISEQVRKLYHQKIFGEDEINV